MCNSWKKNELSDIPQTANAVTNMWAVCCEVERRHFLYTVMALEAFNQLSQVIKSQRATMETPPPHSHRPTHVQTWIFSFSLFKVRELCSRKKFASSQTKKNELLLKLHERHKGFMWQQMWWISWISRRITVWRAEDLLSLHYLVAATCDGISYTSHQGWILCALHLFCLN